MIGQTGVDATSIGFTLGKPVFFRCKMTQHRIVGNAAEFRIYIIEKFEVRLIVSNMPVKYLDVPSS